MDCHSKKVKHLIIGAGMAGLSAAQRLLDHGEHPMIIDGGHFPQDKVCGEFFSPICTPFLKNWGIAIETSIDEAVFHIGSHQYPHPLPIKAQSISRATFDFTMLNKIKERGGDIRTETIVNNIDNDFRVTLTTGEVIEAENLLISTGKALSLLQSKEKPQFKYVGFKAHLPSQEINNTLHMYLFKKCYLGLSPIDGGQINLACLTEIREMNRWGGVKPYIKNLMSQSSHLESVLSSDLDHIDWLTAKVPEFCPKVVTEHKNLFLIGDAAGTLPPATGCGLGMGLMSGVLAADYAIRQDCSGYHKAWQQIYKEKLRLGNGLHWLMSHPQIALPAFIVGNAFPEIFNFLYSRIHRNPITQMERLYGYNTTS